MSWATWSFEQRREALEQLVEEAPAAWERLPSEQRGGWELDREGQAGSLLFCREGLPLCLYATPGWEQYAEDGADLCVVPAEGHDAEGTVLEPPPLRVEWTGVLAADLQLFFAALEPLFRWAEGKPEEKRPRFVAACPKGHADLQLRRPADFQVSGASADGSFLELLDEDRPVSVDWEADGEQGVTSGCWCVECGEWYAESECIHPADDAGNAELPDLGEEDTCGCGDEEECGEPAPNGHLCEACSGAGCSVGEACRFEVEKHLGELQPPPAAPEAPNPFTRREPPMGSPAFLGPQL